MGENADVERKVHLDITDARARLNFVREVAAMMNSGGGRIDVGISDDGGEMGIDDEARKALDPSVLGNLVERFLDPDRVELTGNDRRVSSDRWVVEITVPASLEPPVVLCRPGNIDSGPTTQQTVFSAQSVYVRRNRKAELAHREDHLRWRRQAVERERNALLGRFRMVAEAPADAHVRVVTNDEVRDAPNFFLSRATELFRHRPDRLLSGDELSYLWVHRSDVQFDQASTELIVHSALRRPATLCFWLVFLQLGPAQVKSFVLRSLDITDRDKSDAARSILRISAVYLSPLDYTEVRECMSRSKYAHMKEAAEALPDVAAADASISTLIMSKTAQDLSLDDMERFADDTLRTAEGAASKKLRSIGWEYLRRSRSR